MAIIVGVLNEDIYLYLAGAQVVKPARMSSWLAVGLNFGGLANISRAPQSHASHYEQ